LLHYVALPALFTAGVLAIASSANRTVPARSFAMIAILVGLAVGLASRYADLIYVGDLPRRFLTLTCFVYGIVPILYDLVECKNPTMIDVTIPDFITAADAEHALAILRTQPPPTRRRH
jgi:hypothetical protein